MRCAELILQGTLVSLCLTLAACAGGGSSASMSGAAVAPTIMAQPASQTIGVGGSATFTVNATGTAPLSYQCQKNGAAIAAATAASYSTPAATLADNAAVFKVVVSNAAGSTSSSPAILSVSTVPGTVATDVVMAKNDV